MGKTGADQRRLNASPSKLRARAVGEEHTDMRVGSKGGGASNLLISKHLESDGAVTPRSRCPDFEVRWLDVVLLAEPLRACPNPRILIHRDLHLGLLVLEILS